jgi:hypothetical protein
MPPLSAHIPVAAGWSRPDRRLRTAGPAQSKHPAGLRYRSLGILGADQAKHRECMRHGLDTGCTHPKTPKRPCLRQIPGHQPQVGLGSNSHSHSLAARASPLNHAEQAARLVTRAARSVPTRQTRRTSDPERSSSSWSHAELPPRSAARASVDWSEHVTSSSRPVTGGVRAPVPVMVTGWRECARGQAAGPQRRQ